MRTAICAWCGNPYEPEVELIPDSHGICEECARRELEEFEKTLEQEEK